MTDSDWDTFPINQCSFTGICFMLAGGCIAYKTRLQKTLAMSSMEAKLMAASDAGKMSLFLCSLLHDLKIPQNAATVLFEDHKGAIGMAMAQKPTTHNHHMDIPYFVLVDWVTATSSTLNIFTPQRILQKISLNRCTKSRFTPTLILLWVIFHRNVPPYETTSRYHTNASGTNLSFP
jgi:hypothetical protein